MILRGLSLMRRRHRHVQVLLGELAMKRDRRRGLPFDLEHALVDALGLDEMILSRERRERLMKAGRCLRHAIGAGRRCFRAGRRR